MLHIYHDGLHGMYVCYVSGDVCVCVYVCYHVRHVPIMYVMCIGLSGYVPFWRCIAMYVVMYDVIMYAYISVMACVVYNNKVGSYGS